MSDLHIVMAAVGTVGDAAPFTALAAEAKQRDHRVTLMTLEDHCPMVTDHGIDHLTIGEPDRPQIGRDPLAHFREQLIPAYYNIERAIRTMVEAGDRIFCVFHIGNWGALFACERHRLPFINILLQPSTIWENGQPICAPDLVLINEFRRHLCLDEIQVETIPEPALAKVSLYPDWFGYPESLSPMAGTCVGFPFLRMPGAALPDAIERFIRDKGAPVVFTAGTGVQDIARFVAVARGYHEQTGRPVLFLSRYAGALTELSTERFRVLADLDHGLLFPRAAFVVHNGGIGTTAQALRASVPQVVVPLVWDQPDNAARVEQLGAGFACRPDELTVERLMALAAHIDAMDRKNIMVAGAAVRTADGVAAAVDEIEANLRALAYL